MTRAATQVPTMIVPTRPMRPSPSSRSSVVIALAAALVCTPARADDDRTAAGKAGFLVLYQVLQHPRCVNCHPSGDAPLQYDDARPHAMNISRRSEANGLPCATCHRDKNGTRPGEPPGAPGWQIGRAHV